MKATAFKKTLLVPLILLSFFSFTANAGRKTSDHLYTFEFDSLFVDAVCLRMAGADSAAMAGFERCYELNPGSAAVNYEIGGLKLSDSFKQTDEGLAYLKKAVDAAPDNYYYISLLARLYFQNERYGEAVSAYKRILKKFPDRDEPIYEIAIVYNHIKEFKKSNEMVDKLLRRMGWSRELFFLKARNFISMNDSKSVLKTMDEYLESNPLDYAMWVYKGDVEMELGLMPEAFNSFEKSMEISPDNGPALMSLCNYYDIRRDREKVEFYLFKIFASKDVDFETKSKYLRSAVIYWNGEPDYLQKLEKAQKSMVEADRQNYLTHLSYARFLNLVSRQDDSIDELRTAIYLQPSCMDCWTLLLKSAIDKNDESLATEVLADAVDAIPDSPLFHFYKGSLAYYKEELDSALNSLLIADSLVMKKSDLDTLNVLAMYNIIGDIYNRKGNVEKTLVYMRKAMDYNPNDLVSINNYAYYMALNNRDLDNIAELSFKTVKSDPLNPTFLDTYAYILMKQKKYGSAYFYISQALQYDNKEKPNAEIIEHLGDIQYFMGEIDNAVETWRKAKILGSPNPKLDEKINRGEYVE